MVPGSLTSNLDSGAPIAPLDSLVLDELAPATDPIVSTHSFTSSVTSRLCPNLQAHT